MTRRSYGELGDVTFFCGAAGGVHVTDEHDIAAREYTWKRHEEAFHRGERPSVDQWAEWLAEGRLASERRMSLQDSAKISEAIALLEKHGYKVRAPRHSTSSMSVP